MVETNFRDELIYLSVIIPVYNVELWLPRCMEGVLMALPEDGEVILVTGPSKDNSNTLCNEFAQKDIRIKVIRQNGKGLANARNCGFDASSGEHIVYIDGDDTIDSALFAGLINRLRILDGEFDVAMTDCRQVAIDGKVIDDIFHIGTQTKEARGEAFLGHVLQTKKCFWNVWRYIYKREFLVQHDITFLEEHLSEDMDYIAKVYAARPRFVFFHCPYYRYSIGRGDSLMDQPTLIRLNDTVTNISCGIKLMEKAALPYSSAFIEQYQYEFILCMALCVEIKKENRTKAYTLYNETLDILEVGNYPMARFVRRILKVLPISAGAWSLHFMKILKRRLRGDARKTVFKE